MVGGGSPVWGRREGDAWERGEVHEERWPLEVGRGGYKDEGLLEKQGASNGRRLAEASRGAERGSAVSARRPGRDPNVGTRLGGDP